MTYKELQYLQNKMQVLSYYRFGISIGQIAYRFGHKFKTSKEARQFVERIIYKSRKGELESWD